MYNGCIFLGKEIMVAWMSILKKNK